MPRIMIDILVLPFLSLQDGMQGNKSMIDIMQSMTSHMILASTLSSFYLMQPPVVCIWLHYQSRSMIL